MVVHLVRRHFVAREWAAPKKNRPKRMLNELARQWSRRSWNVNREARKSVKRIANSGSSDNGDVTKHRWILTEDPIPNAEHCRLLRNDFARGSARPHPNPHRRKHGA